MNIKKIIEVYNTLDGKEDSIQISKCEKVENPKKTLKSHIIFLKSNSGNKRFNPYFERCVKIVNHFL